MMPYVMQDILNHAEVLRKVLKTYGKVAEFTYLTSVDDIDLNGVEFCNPQFLDNASISKYIGSVDEDDDYYRWIHQERSKNTH